MKQLITLLLISITMKLFSQQVYPLYPSAIPNSKPSPDRESSQVDGEILAISNVSRPTLTAYFPPEGKSNGDAIIIIPGGGYHIVAAGHEGVDVAKKFNEMGIIAFVLKYRLPNAEWMLNPEIGPLQDAQRAIQMVRENARKWKINKKASDCWVSQQEDTLPQLQPPILINHIYRIRKK